MLGSVWEWCADWYDSKYYASSPAADPPGRPVPRTAGRPGRWLGAQRRGLPPGVPHDKVRAGGPGAATWASAWPQSRNKQGTEPSSEAGPASKRSRRRTGPTLLISACVDREPCGRENRESSGESRGGTRCLRPFPAWTRIWKTRRSFRISMTALSPISGRSFRRAYHLLTTPLLDVEYGSRLRGVQLVPMCICFVPKHSPRAKPSRPVPWPLRLAPRRRPVVVKVLHDEFREPFVEIYVRTEGGRRLVTSIEVLSPSNKTPGDKGRDLFLRKQKELLSGKVNLVDIDLLRGGKHATAVPLEQALAACGSFRLSRLGPSLRRRRNVLRLPNEPQGTTGDDRGSPLTWRCGGVTRSPSRVRPML